MSPSPRCQFRPRYAAALIAAAAATTRALAADQTYIGPNMGNWSDPTLWSAGSTPANGDNAGHTQSSDTPVTLVFDDAAVVGNLNQMVVDSFFGALLTFLQPGNSFSTTTEYVGMNGQGAVTLQNGKHTISGGGNNALYVGYNFGATGTFTFNGGTLNVTDSEYIGYAGNGTFNHNGGIHSINGYLVLGGDASGANTSGVGTYNFGGPFGGGQLTANTVYVGLSGTGVFNQSNGFFNPGNIVVGYFAGSSGIINLSGGASYAGNAVTLGSGGRGQLFVTGGTHTYAGLVIADAAAASGTSTISGGSLTVVGPELVGNHGIGVINQSGGVHQPQFDLYLGVQSGSTGSMTLSNNAILLLPQNPNNGFPYGGNEYVGYNGVGIVNQTGGNHAIDSYLALGRQGGGSGTYTLSGGTLSAPQESVGYLSSANNLFTQSGGQNTANNYLTVGDQLGAHGTYNLTGGSLNVANLYASWRGAGAFNQSGGTATLGTLYVAHEPGAVGTVTLSAGKLNVSGPEYIGFYGTGTFSQNGGTHSSGDLFLGGTSGGAGTYNLTGGSLAVAGNIAKVGGSNTTANLNLSGGLLDVQNHTIGAATNPIAITFSGGTLQNVLQINGGGTLTKSGTGTAFLAGSNSYSGPTAINAGTLQIGTGGSGGSIGTGPVIDNAALVINRTGALTIPGNISGAGSLSQTGTVVTTLSGNNGAYSGHITVSAGTLVAGSSNALGSGNVSLNGGSYLLFNPGTMTATFVNNIALSGAPVVDSAFGVTTTLSGVISGSGSFNTGTNGGTIVLAGTNSYTGGTVLNGGVLSAPGLANLGAATSTVTINNASLLLTYGAGASPADTIRSLLQTGYNGGLWNGTGITSAAAATTGPIGGLGYADGINGAAPGTVLIKYVAAGDINLSGKVTIADYNVLANNFNKFNVSLAAHYSDGDLNFDGKVSIADYNILANNFNKTTPVTPSASPSAASASPSASLSGSAGPAAVPANGLELDVNTVTGDVTVLGNNATNLSSLDTISNAGSSLNSSKLTIPAGFTTLYSGDDEIALVLANISQKQSINGTVDLGLIFRTNMPRDLTFSYGQNGQTINANVVYVNGVPEPTTLSLLGLGAAGLLGRRRRRNARGGVLRSHSWC